MKFKCLLILLAIASSKIFTSQEEERLSLKATGLLPELQQIVIDYTGPDKWTLSKVLSEHTKKVNALSISGDGSILVSGSEDQKVKIWDIKTGICIKTLDFSEQKQYRGSVWEIDQGTFEDIIIDYVSISNDAKYIAILNNFYFISIYDRIEDRYLVHDINLEQDFNIVKNHLFEGFKDRTIMAESLITDKELKKSMGLISFSPNDKFLIFTSNTPLFKLWDITNLKCLLTLYPNDIAHIRKNNEFARDKFFGFIKSNLNIDIWDCQLGIINNGFCKKISKTNTNLIASYFDILMEKNKIKINYSNQKSKLIFDWLEESYESLSKSIRDEDDSEGVYSLVEEKLPIDTFVLSPDGRFLAVAVGNDIKIWNNNIQQLRSS